MKDIKILKQKIENLHVLFVDDEEEIRIGTGMLLRKFFKHVDIYSNGQEAMDHFSKDKYDVLITDIKMPKMDGVELVSHIKKIQPNMYIIFVTASRGDIELNKEHSDMYINKPISYENIIMMMENICENFYND
ncbi:MAG: response regulator [Campylobacterota bacterium]|nr:response regulator [Campylobacterota bacterium]